VLPDLPGIMQSIGATPLQPVRQSCATPVPLRPHEWICEYEGRINGDIVVVQMMPYVDCGPPRGCHTTTGETRVVLRAPTVPDS
jgi:hypothetical protein